MKKRILSIVIPVLLIITMLSSRVSVSAAAESNDGINMSGNLGADIAGDGIKSRNKLIIVGDSRTFNMSKWITTTFHTEFIAKNGQGYQWFTKEAVAKVNRIIKPGDSILIWLGVNDYFSDSLGDDSWVAYSKKINSLALNEWAACKVYVASVGYVDRNRIIDYFGKDSRANVTKINGKNGLNGIREFNSNLKACLDKKITWIDTYEVIGIKNSDTVYIPDNIWATRRDGRKDGLHYGEAKTQEIYNYFLKYTVFSDN